MEKQSIIRSCSGESIHSVEDWLRLAPPQKKWQWKDGRSAKELAKAWTRADMPEEFRALLAGNERTAGFAAEYAVPEVVIPLDEFGGNTRHSDLVVYGHTSKEKVVIAVEAKADEPFGTQIKPYYDKKLNSSSKVPARVDQLLGSIFGRQLDEDNGKLRYQLLHAFAGTLIEARERKATLAVFVVHEFHSPQLDHKKLDRNHGDLVAFLNTFEGLKDCPISAGNLYGPIRVPGGGRIPGDIDCLAGKVRSPI